MNKYASGNKDVEIILLIDNNEDKSTAELKMETKASKNDLKSIFHGKSPLSHIHSIIYLDTLGKFYQDSFIKEKKDLKKDADGLKDELAKLKDELIDTKEKDKPLIKITTVSGRFCQL